MTLQVPHPISSFMVEKQQAMGLECSPRKQTSQQNAKGWESSFWKNLIHCIRLTCSEGELITCEHL